MYKARSGKAAGDTLWPATLSLAGKSTVRPCVMPFFAMSKSRKLTSCYEINPIAKSDCMSQPKMTDADYILLANFRTKLRRFIAFSDNQARNVGLTPQQHQALLTIWVAREATATVG